MRKSASFALITAFAFVSLNAIQSKPAHALIGAVLWNPTIAYVGAATMAGGIVVASVAVSAGGLQGLHNAPPGAPQTVALGIIAVPVGLLILDDNTTSFGPLSPEQARTVGLNENEAQAYADELAEISAISGEVNSGLQAEFESTGQPTVKTARALWTRMSTELSPEALLAVKKISAHAINQAIKTRSAH